MAQPATIAYSEGGFLDRCPWYVQLLGLLGIILVILGAVHYFVMQPMRNEAEKKNQEAETLRRENQEAETIRQNIEAYQKTLDELNVKLDALRVRLPEEREVTNIFENAKSMISGSGLKLVQFQTSTKDRNVDKGFYTEVNSGVKVAGSYGAIQELFRKLSAYERIVNVTDITLGKAGDQDQASGATTVGSFNLTAFYLSDANRKKLEETVTQEIDPKTGKPVVKKDAKKKGK
jgi:Tfp pilus assembly protein PilO